MRERKFQFNSHLWLRHLEPTESKDHKIRHSYVTHLMRTATLVTCIGLGVFAIAGCSGTGSEPTGVSRAETPSGISQVVADDFGGCVVMAAGAVRCWGFSLNGLRSIGADTGGPADLTAVPAVASTVGENRFSIGSQR